jgi:hypothetical protein
MPKNAFSLSDTNHQNQIVNTRGKLQEANYIYYGASNLHHYRMLST